MLLAGGQGSRLGILTKKMAKPAIQFGGKYRIIDFTLSNCINSGIDTVGVVTQYQPLRLNEHIGIGIPWDLDKYNGGVTVLSPHIKGEKGAWFSGTANAVYQNIDFIQRYDPEYVLILSGDHVYKMDYSEMLSFHKENNCGITIAVLQVPMNETHRFGIMNVNEEDKIIEFQEKPKYAKSDLASMGVYVFDWKVLKDLLTEDHEIHEQSDFGKHIIPRALEKGMDVYAYRFQGYWKDVGTVETYWKANMELIEIVPIFNLYETNWKIYTENPMGSPVYVDGRGEIRTSIIGEGTEVQGSIYHSVLGSGVIIEEGAVVRDSIIMSNTRVKKNALVERAIISEDVTIGENTKIGIGDNITNEEWPNLYYSGISVIGERTNIPDYIEIGKNCVVYGQTFFQEYPQGKLESGRSLIHKDVMNA